MKKYFAMMVAVLFLFGVVGLSFAQVSPEKTVKDTGPDKRSDAQKKRQEVTPEKKKASEAPTTQEGAKIDKKPVKKSEKSKKRQAQTPEKKKAAEAPADPTGKAPTTEPAKK
jgi:cytoskeletal protein RodZ